jgi:predicted transcriptional regulator
MDKPSKRASQMQRIVEEYGASGLSRREFAHQRGIPVTTLDYWRQRSGRKPRLLKVEVARAEAAAQSFTRRLANGRAIESSFPLAEQELAQLIRIAESA